MGALQKKQVRWEQRLIHYFPSSHAADPCSRSGPVLQSLPSSGCNPKLRPTRIETPSRQWSTPSAKLTSKASQMESLTSCADAYGLALICVDFHYSKPLARSLMLMGMILDNRFGIRCWVIRCCVIRCHVIRCCSGTPNSCPSASGRCPHSSRRVLAAFLFRFLSVSYL